MKTWAFVQSLTVQVALMEDRLCSLETADLLGNTAHQIACYLYEKSAHPFSV